MSGKYYTYEIENSLTGKVFYIGKGTGDRMDQHERDARNGAQRYVPYVIRSIWEQGGFIVKRKVFETDIEQDAYLHEWCLVQLVYGIDNLANACEGGNGGIVERKRIYKQITISLSCELLDAIYRVEGQTLTGYVRYLLSIALSGNVEQALRQEHSRLLRIIDIRPRCETGAMLPLDIVLRLQEIPRGLRSAFVELAAREDMNLLIF